MQATLTPTQRMLHVAKKSLSWEIILLSIIHFLCSFDNEADPQNDSADWHSREWIFRLDLQDFTTFPALFAALGKFQTLKLLVLREPPVTLNGVFWEPLAQLQQLETLVVVVRDMKAESVTFASKMSKPSLPQVRSNFSCLKDVLAKVLSRTGHNILSASAYGLFNHLDFHWLPFLDMKHPHILSDCHSSMQSGLQCVGALKSLSMEIHGKIERGGLAPVA